MKTSELKQSKYMKKEDCGDDGILVTIAALKQENVAPDNKPEELKWILHFNGDHKPLVLNGTNTKLIEKALGSDETDDWIGQKIVLFNDENVEYMGEVVGGVRCDVTRTKRYIAKQNTTQVPAKPGTPKHFDDLKDDIPF
jgi:hypothetical protein